MTVFVEVSESTSVFTADQNMNIDFASRFVKNSVRRAGSFGGYPLDIRN